MNRTIEILKEATEYAVSKAGKMDTIIEFTEEGAKVTVEMYVKGSANTIQNTDDIKYEELEREDFNPIYETILILESSLDQVVEEGTA